MCTRTCHSQLLLVLFTVALLWLYFLASSRVFPRHSRAKNYQKAMEKSLSPFHCAVVYIYTVVLYIVRQAVYIHINYKLEAAGYYS